MYIVIITKEGSIKIVTFMTPGAGVLVLRCGHISHIVKMHYFFINFLLYPQAKGKVSDTQVTVKACGPLVLYAAAD
mgnify:CR=1 FL=1